MGCHPTKIFKGHTKDWVDSVAYFPDGRRIAGASDKAVIIWDVESGRRDGQPLLHESSVEWMALSPNGRRIASGTGDRVVVWDVLTREVVHEIKCGVNRLAYSPDGSWIATASTGVGREVQMWDADTGRPGREPLICDNRVWCMTFSPDGSRIAAGLHDGSFQVLDIATGKSVVGPIKGHTYWVNSVVYSLDGRRLLTGSRDRTIRVWNSKTGVQVGKPMLGHEDHVACISICADGRRIASGGWDGTVRVWDLKTRLQVGDSFNAGVWVLSQSVAHTSVAFSPDGRYVVSGGPDLDHVYLWDTESLASKGSVSIFIVLQYCF
ncbi:WD40 repeat-like protein [Leucogyrophana mollusca]|uniref:WD40 repeat-like protein n=1 Tax=Leucogyrophana mollusca TaxID=85980 RepID=A0ACB8B3J4_9AGAM|nr:WD40 repeat-like protein [Leucogyrophana mollusca]